MDATFVQLIISIIVGGGASTYITQLLKQPFIKIPAEKHPVPTAAVISLIGGVLVLLASGVSFDVKNLPAFAASWLGALLIAVFTYNQTRKGLPSGK